MKKQISIFFAATGVLSLAAREFRTPLPIIRYPLYQLLLVQEKGDWQIDGWAAGFFRKADEALIEKTGTATGKKQPLSQLIFGKADFQAQEAFANAKAEDRLNPFLDSIMSPRIKYTDRGFIIGIQGMKKVSQHWGVGARGHLPFRSIKVKKTESPGTGSSLFGGEALADVAQTKQEQFGGNSIQTYAVRLDFLSKLPANCTPLGLTLPLVQYNTPTAQGHITIGGIDITDAPQFQNGEDQRNSVTVIKRDNKTAPTTFGVPVATAQALPDLSGDGTQAGANLLNNDGRAKFSMDINYTPLGTDRTTQERLWIVPSVNQANNALIINAKTILQAISDILNCTNNSPEAIFLECGLSFDDQKRRGVGDLDAELFAQYYFRHCCFIEAILGLRLPTGKKIDNEGNIFELPLGNNGHPEVKIGAKGRWEPCEWFQLNADSSYSFVPNKTERVPATFIGATVKSLGPIVPARISWGYYCGHIDGHVFAFNGENHKVNGGLGYELYHKRKDSVKFLATTAVDCIKKTQPLDANVIERLTRVTSHKLYFDLSYIYKADTWQVDIFGGGSWVVGGSNTPREHDGFVAVRFSILG